MHSYKKGLLIAFSVAFSASSWAGGCPAGFNTCIEVNVSGDPTPGGAVTSNTCSNNPGACSFRRAVNESNGLLGAERPVLISFNLPANEENSNAPGTWTINLDPFTGLPNLSSISSFDDPDSSVTVDGSTQPGARTGAPAVFINSDEPWAFARASNTITNMGFYGGISLTLGSPSGNNSRPDGSHMIDSIWMGLDETGMNIVLEDDSPSGASGLAGGGIFMTSESNTVQNSVISGAPGAAIQVNTEDENRITGNYIGTRGDGTIPAGQDCAASPSFDFGNWYGGWGIAVLGGDDIEVTNNVVAGLQDVRQALDTPPIAIRFWNVTNSLLSGNVIGIDATDASVGTCGGAIDVYASPSAFAGLPTLVVDNVVADSRQNGNEEFVDTAIYISRGSALTIQNNMVEHTISEAVNKVIDFSPTGVEEAWRLFEPGAITDINDTAVTGTNGAYLDEDQNLITTTCGGCTIEIFADDLDEKEEALELLATTTADGAGNFNATLSRALGPDEGLRTISTSNANQVIGSQNRGTSTKMSVLFEVAGEDPGLIFADNFGG